MLLSLTHVPRGGGYDNGQKTPVEKPTGHFSLWQLTSASDTIGNSYVLKTAAGHLILIDGGMETNGDAAKLRSYIKAQGNNKVDAWWFSHPHGDHIGAFLNIADDLQGITIDTIYYSRLADSIKEGRALTDRFNKKLDEMSAAGVNVYPARPASAPVTIWTASSSRCWASPIRNSQQQAKGQAS